MKTERAIAEFINYKQSLGRRYSSRSIILRAFARVAGGSDIRKVTPDIVRKFIDGRGPVTNAWFARFSTLNCLFRYALSRNYIAVSPLPKLKPRRPVEFRPYIYSAADVKKLWMPRNHGIGPVGDWRHEQYGYCFSCCTERA
jgi:hypothetical protein